MRPFRGSLADRRPADQPLFHYPYVEWRAALAAMARSAEIDPHLGHALEFRNPADGGSIMPTIAAHVRLLPRGYSRSEEHTSELQSLMRILYAVFCLKKKKMSKTDSTKILITYEQRT